NCPLNGLLVSLIILGRIPQLKMFFVGPVSVEEFIFIFGIHLLIANVNKKIHRPCKQFIGLSLEHGHSWSFPDRLRLSILIETFITRRRYGFTYHTFGRISLLAFVKVSNS